jgi:hypothetical protein
MRIRAKFSDLAQDAEFADPIRKISEVLGTLQGKGAIKEDQNERAASITDAVRHGVALRIHFGLREPPRSGSEWCAASFIISQNS